MTSLVEMVLAPDSPFREPGLSPEMRGLVEVMIADVVRAYALTDEEVRAAFYDLDAGLLDLFDCFEGWLFVRDALVERLGIRPILPDTLN